jgi:hypothetical protein
VNVVVTVEVNAEEPVLVSVDVLVDLQPHEAVVVVMVLVRTEVRGVENVEVKVEV